MSDSPTASGTGQHFQTDSPSDRDQDQYRPASNMSQGQGLDSNDDISDESASFSYYGAHSGPWSQAEPMIQHAGTATSATAARGRIVDATQLMLQAGGRRTSRSRTWGEDLSARPPSPDVPSSAVGSETFSAVMANSPSR